MEGEAPIWYQTAIDTCQLMGWDSFVKALQVRYGLIAYDDPMEVLTHLKQTTTIVAKTQFEGLSNQLKGLLEKYKLSCFLRGLKDEVWLPIRMLNPINLSVAFGLAKIQEQYLWNSIRALKGIVISGEGQPFGGSEDVSREFQKNNGLAGRYHLCKWKKREGIEGFVLLPWWELELKPCLWWLA